MAREKNHLPIMVEGERVDWCCEVHDRLQRLWEWASQARVVVDVNDAAIRPAKLEKRQGGWEK